jgi:hypothetical protein
MRYDFVKTGSYYGIVDLEFFIIAPMSFYAYEIPLARKTFSEWEKKDFTKDKPWLYGWIPMTLKDMIQYHRNRELTPSKRFMQDNDTWVCFTEEQYRSGKVGELFQ